MKIYVVGSTKNKFLQLNNIRQKFLIDEKHNDDNIDNLNPWYCELTGLYHLWKNCNDDIVGLEHYRRYFINDSGNLLSESEINKILQNYDIIAFKSNKTKTKLLENIKHIMRIPGKKNYDLTPTFKKILFTACYNKKCNLKDGLSILNQNWHYKCNMFICKKELINKYCKWLQDIMIEVKKIFNIKLFEKRSIGYVVEILLFPLWLKIENIKIYSCKVKEC